MPDHDYSELLGGITGAEPADETMRRIGDRLTRAIDASIAGEPLPGEERNSDDDEGVIVVGLDGQDADEPKTTPWFREPRTILAAAAAAALIVGLAIALQTGDDDTDIGPVGSTTTSSTTTDAPTTQPPEDEFTFEGTWTVGSGSIEAVFEGGTYELRRDGESVDAGTFSTTSSSIRLRTTPASINCGLDEVGAWEYVIVDADTVTLDFLSDDCEGNRQLGFPRVTLQRSTGESS